MKILMRADTHVHLDIPETTPAAKCTISQVFLLITSRWHIINANVIARLTMQCSFSGYCRSVGITGVNDGRLHLGLHISGPRVHEFYGQYATDHCK